MGPLGITPNRRRIILSVVLSDFVWLLSHRKKDKSKANACSFGVPSRAFGRKKAAKAALDGSINVVTNLRDHIYHGHGYWFSQLAYDFAF